MECLKGEISKMKDQLVPQKETQDEKAESNSAVSVNLAVIVVLIKFYSYITIFIYFIHIVQCLIKTLKSL